jgi:TolB-like protein
MTDAIISRMAKIKSIKRVIPFTSMLAYKKTDKTIVEIAKELGVKNILQGSFQLSGDNVSIKVQMIDGISEQQYWENAYYQIWKTTEIFEIQSAVAENVAENINASITASEKESIEQIPTTNKEAYRLYLQGNYQFQQRGGGSITNALHLYESAIALDSTFIEPYIGLSIAYLLSGAVWGIIPEKEAWSNAKLILQKALKIDQRNSNAFQEAITRRFVLGAFLYEWDIEAIDSVYNRTTAMPHEGGIADYAVKTGKFDDFLSFVNDNLDNFPTLGRSYVAKASALFFLGRQEEALALLSKQDEIYDEDYYFLMETAKYYLYMGEQEKSSSQLRLFKSKFADRPPIIIWLDAVHAEMEGQPEMVAKSLSLLEEAYNQKASGSPAWFMALYYCHIKDYDKAFAWLRKSYTRHEIEMTWLKEEPILRPLKNDPRYLELYEKVGFSILDL